MNDLSHLQNGSDLRGVALSTETTAANLDAAIAARIGAAFVRQLAAKRKTSPEALRIGIGHDSRVTAACLEQGLVRGIAFAGAKATCCHLASTPSMFCATRYPETAFDGTVMITASHLPMERNGFKFFTAEGGYDKKDISALLAIAEEMPLVESRETPCDEYDLLSRYSAELREKICAAVNAPDYDKPLQGLHVVVDAGNGAGGFFVEQVLRPLGADTAGSRFLEPDGTFPNHIPNPENKAAMASIREATIGAHADLGLIFDTDVDRMSAVLPDGAEVNRDAIIAIMAAILAPEYPHSTIVTDSVTSDRLTRFLEQELGLRHHRFMRGYKNVINESIRLNREGIVSPLAIETSGHGALSENYFLDDGAYLAVRLLIAAAKAKREGKALSSLIEALEPEADAAERRIPIVDADFKTIGKKALLAFEENANRRGLQVVSPSYEGIRLSLPEGWMLLRMSLHDPLLPLNVEGNRAGDSKRLLALARELFDGVEGIDCSVL